MTEPTDPTPLRLDALDQRAAAAVADLDRAAAELPVPDAPDAPTRRPRFLAPALVAASVVVVALVAAAIAIGGNDEQGTVAGEPEAADRLHLVLADPAAEGYEIAGVFDDRDPGTVPSGPTIPVTVQALPGGDPWTRALVEYALPSDSTTLDGETVDLAGTVGVYRERDGLRSIGWEDGDLTRYLVSTDLGSGEVIKAAARAIVVGAGPGERIAEPDAAAEDYEILFRGTITDVFQSQTTAPPPDTSGVIYAGETEQTVDLVVRTTVGSPDHWRAAQVLAVERVPTTARGHDAVVVTGPEGLTEVSWMEDEGTLVRVGTSAPTLDLDLLDRLEVIGDDEFATLLAERPIDAPDTSLPTDDEGISPVASVRSETGTAVVEARLGRLDDGTYALDIEQTDQGTGSGVSQSADLGTPSALRLELPDGRTAVAGIIGPAAGPHVGLGHEEPNTAVDGADVEGPSTATIEGSDSLLFLVVLPAGVDPDGVTAETTAPDGSIVTLPLRER